MINELGVVGHSVITVAVTCVSLLHPCPRDSFPSVFLCWITSHLSPLSIPNLPVILLEHGEAGDECRGKLGCFLWVILNLWPIGPFSHTKMDGN